jgi:deoxycytidine triphosphate deaminase
MLFYKSNPELIFSYRNNIREFSDQVRRQVDNLSLNLGKSLAAYILVYETRAREDDFSTFTSEVELECFSDSYFLQPKQFVLAQTFEYFALPNFLVGHLDGRSSLARQGLMVHATAGLVDPGFKGHLVFELLNAGEMPIKLYPLMRLAKMSFNLTQPTDGYTGQYNMQIKIRGPKNDEDLKKISDLMIKKNKEFT